jgi:phage tail protein X
MPAGTSISLPDNTEEPDTLDDEGSPTVQEWEKPAILG